MLKFELMKSYLVKSLINLFFVFMIGYLTYHTLYGNYNLQNYYINKFEIKMFEDFNYRLKQSLVDVNKDIFALHYQFEDMQDEIAKRKMPLPAQGEVLIKLD